MVLSIIDSLSAGYRFLGRRFELIILPILLDLLLWLAPRFSVAPLLKQFAAWYSQTVAVQGMPSGMTDLSKQVSTMLLDAGQHSNLLDGLVSSTLLHVPSFLVTMGSRPETGVVLEIANPLEALALTCLFGLLGMLIGVIYMNLLATKLPLGGGPKPMAPGTFVRTVLRHWFMVSVYVVLMIALFMAGSIPVALGTALLSFVSPTLGSFMVVLFSGAVVVVLFYLYFVTAALILDNLPLHLAVVHSFILVRNNFWAALGFWLLTYLISWGIFLAVRGLTAISPLGTLAAIVIYTYIGSGLTMALLVFYRTRILRTLEGATTPPSGR